MAVTGIPRTGLLTRPTDFGVATFRLTEEGSRRETRLARG
jgi:hypothetical protein